MDLFRNLGNAYCNSVWEGKLLLTNERQESINLLQYRLCIMSQNLFIFWKPLIIDFYTEILCGT